MKFAKLLACYHPTTVLFVDDNTDFLKTLLLNFMQQIPCRSYNNPQEVLSLLDHIQTQSLLKRYSNGDDNNSGIALRIDIQSLHQEIYNANRFGLATILVTDQAMPGLTGLDLCKQLKHHFIKKIMLTGKMSYAEAVQAFNEGYIDKFLMKASPDLPKLLISSIEALLQKPFMALTDIVVNSSTQLNKLLTDPMVVNLFNTIYQSHDIVEHYLLDELGSFLLLDKQAKPYLLLLRTEAEMATLANHAAIENLAPSLVSALNQRGVIPCASEIGNFDTLPADWEASLFPAKLLQGEQDYYYSFIGEPVLTDLNSANLTAYQMYLTRL